jgi:hypothetical protein
MELTLWFDKDLQLSLSRTEVKSPAFDGIRSAIRGRIAPSFMNLGTFTWSPAVRAASLLLVKWAATEVSDSPHSREPVMISGGIGSQASSLDYAIDKAPLWLLDVFGNDTKGAPMARRLFCRLNPGRRRSGPVTICINPNLLRSNDVAVHLNGERLKRGSAQLIEIIRELEEDLYSQKPSARAPTFELPSRETEEKSKSRVTR